jgi:hypothetical protein
VNAIATVSKLSTGGRPTAYRESFAEELIEFAADGASLKAFAAEKRVARQTLLNWAEQHEEFAEAVEIAKARACAWWEKRARQVANGKGGPGAASMCQFALKNFGAEDFSDRREVNYTGAIQHNLTYEQAIEEARRRGLPERVLLAETLESEE